MARNLMHEVSIHDWSCPLCTLLNAAEEIRCAACDNLRPVAHQLQASQHLEPSIVAATASEAQVLYRRSAGVFYSSLPRDQSDLDASSWKKEKRLVVNRRRGNWCQNRFLSAERKENQKVVETPRQQEETSRINTQVQGTDHMEKTIAALGKKGERQEEEEEEETAMDVDEPCFNLLGLGAAVFAAPTVEYEVKDQGATAPAMNQNSRNYWDEYSEVSASLQDSGFIPASKLHPEEIKIREKMACAGLNLSDLEDEDNGEPKRLRRQNDDEKDSWEDKWVCQICTNLNGQILLQCSSCNSKRYRNLTLTAESSRGPNMQWACHVCTNINPLDVTKCSMCLSLKETTSKGLKDQWQCSLCATFHPSSTTQCEVCDQKQDDCSETVTESGPQCPVCTNIYAPGRTRCELCDSTLPVVAEVPCGHYIDLSSSPLKRKTSYTNDDDELNNPYANLSRYNDYDAPNEVVNAGPDYVDDIVDNEFSTLDTNSRPLAVRSELKEFKHFVCMEDLRSDCGCRINYTQMFAGQRSKKSYSDRLAIRQAQSRKRKRSAANKESGQSKPTSTSRGDKTAKGGKKRKTTATTRRASVSGAKAPKPKKAKKAGYSARRASSTTPILSSVSHYDDSSADFGEDLNTMAWEGMGSAGYF